jgi:hypothetical protein
MVSTVIGGNRFDSFGRFGRVDRFMRWCCSAVCLLSLSLSPSFSRSEVLVLETKEPPLISQHPMTSTQVEPDLYDIHPRRWRPHLDLARKEQRLCLSEVG